jgi:hypothetical protein
MMMIEMILSFVVVVLLCVCLHLSEFKKFDFIFVYDDDLIILERFVISFVFEIKTKINSDLFFKFFFYFM